MANRVMTDEEATIKERFIVAARNENLSLAKPSAIPVQILVRSSRGGTFEKAWKMWLSDKKGDKPLGLITASGFKKVDDITKYQFQSIKP